MSTSASLSVRLLLNLDMFYYLSVNTAVFFLRLVSIILENFCFFRFSFLVLLVESIVQFFYVQTSINSSVFVFNERASISFISEVL